MIISLKQRINEYLEKNDHLNDRLGQNFIFDLNILKKIVEKSEINNKDIVIEIGAGLGFLTELLCLKAKKVYSFEIDLNLEDNLKILNENNSNLEIIFYDFLKYNLNDILDNHKNENIKVVANIPYYITTNIIQKLIEYKEISNINILMQKEVAKRAVSLKDQKEYSALSVQLQSLFIAKIAFLVSKNVFYPVPDVESAFLTLTKKENNFFSNENRYTSYNKLVLSFFQNRRKNILNNLSFFLKISKEKTEEILINLNLNKNLRPENLDIYDYKKINEFIILNNLINN